MILLDTHALVWYALDEPRLGRSARRRIQSALRDGGVAASAISYWEIAMLAEAGRLRLDVGVESFRAEALARGIDEIAVGGTIAILASRLHGVHADPADRFILATALERGATLVTADAKMLASKSGPSRIDAQR